MGSLLLSLLAIAGGVPGDPALNAVGRLNWYCSAILVRPDVVLTERHCHYDGWDHTVTWPTGETATIASWYLPATATVDDAAIGYLATPVTTITPLGVRFDVVAADDLLLAGVGHSTTVLTCSTWMVTSNPPNYIQFPTADAQQGPGCGTEPGDSGGALFAGGDPRVAGVLATQSTAASLARYAADPAFLALAAAPAKPQPSACAAARR